MDNVIAVSARRPKPVDAPLVGQLMGRVAGGDTTSFAALYDVLAPSVYQLAASLCVDERVVEQATAEAFTTMWRTARNCPAAGAEALMWAMDITYQHTLSCSRGAPRRRAGAGSGSVGQGGVAALTGRQRASVMLTCGGALTYRQVANIIDEPAHTGAVLQRDALIRLRDRTATAASTAPRRSPQ